MTRILSTLCIFIAFHCNLLEAADKPNILFILVDDLGWKDLGCYGSSFIETPVADRFAKEGMRFTDAYAAAPVCSPTRASLLTGQYQNRFGMFEVTGLKDRPNVKMKSPTPARSLPTLLDTLGEILSRSGYVCASLGKWHVGGRPQDEGFIKLKNTGPQKWKDQELDKWARENSQKQIGNYTSHAIRFLREHRDHPFLLMVNHHAVHVPLAARKDLISKYEMKAEQTDDREHHPTYAAMTEQVDESLGLIMAELDQLGLSRNTVVIFTSDNGGLTQDLFRPRVPDLLVTSVRPLRGEKGTVYEGGIRIPLIVRWPGVVKKNSVCRSPVITSDLFATMLDIGGTQVPEGQVVDGLSLMPLLQQRDTLGREALYWHFPTSCWSRQPTGAIRKGKYKLIEFFEDDHIELYDLETDIGETVNLASTQPERAAELLQDIRSWRRSIQARMPTPNPEYDPSNVGGKYVDGIWTVGATSGKGSSEMNNQTKTLNRE